MGTELFALDGRVALVTGGNGGLGRAIALGLRDAGATVAVTGRDTEKNQEVAAELGDPRAVIAGDVRDEAKVEETIDQVVERFGRLDILVNNAGNYSMGSVLDLTAEQWHGVIDTHLTGSFLCAKHAARVMVRQGEGGKIINIGSIYSLFGTSVGVSYASAKAGLLGLTRSLAVELASHDIQVNAILPGWYETGMTRGAPNTKWGQRVRAKTPAGRWGNPEELAGAAVFLSSKASDFVTGVILPVDGGFSVADGVFSG